MFIADFHIHSRHSRATSRDCVPEILELWARRKGLGLLGSGDFTHRGWRDELRQKLEPAEEGLYRLKQEFCQKECGHMPAMAPRFIISGEISSIYKKGGKVRKVHNLILLPSLEAAETLSRRLEEIGNLHSDGRPILGLDSRDLLEITLENCAEAIFIPAHIWTPHFSLFGAYSGFDDIRDCFEDLTPHIHGLETGLSSDPPMNWRVSALDGYTLISNSDAHSPSKLAREANIFHCDLSYPRIRQALVDGEKGEFGGTLEFFPEEGKYHYDGHRPCHVCQKPAETRAGDALCPACGGKITLGVLHRVEELADREEGFKPPGARAFEYLAPLPEVIAAANGFSQISKKGIMLYEDLLRKLGPELFVLREAPLAEIQQLGGLLLAEGIRRLRAGEVELSPGYDGVFGKLKIFDADERQRLLGQQYLFSAESGQILAPPPPLPAKKQAKAANAAKAAKEPGPSSPGLNREQQEAVCSGHRVVAVVAGPGTGKTKTLVARILHLLKQGVLPGQISAVTFTNKAAQELRSRLEQELGGKRAAKGLHIATFHGLCLRLAAQKPGGGQSLLDEANGRSIMGEALSELGLMLSVREALRAVSLCKNGARTADTLPEGLYEAYQSRLEAYGAMDFDDILVRALAESDEPRECFKQLLVDEFQDINPLQYRLIKAWGRHSDGIFVIGDPQQSIYGFRGADAACFKWLYEDFPEAQTIRLVQNYRSTPQILRCAALLMPKNEPALTAWRDSGREVRLLSMADAGAEAIWLAKEIGRLVGGLDMQESREQPYGFADIAVLYRANRQAELLERCLQREGIPYSVGGRGDFLDDEHVLRALAFFRYVLNPADQLSARLCLQEQAESGAMFAEDAAKYRARLGREKPAKLLESYLNEQGLWQHQPMEKLFRMALLQQDMPTFLHNLALGQDGDLWRSGSKRYLRQSVSLMTFHAAKGLEFPVVFLAGLTEGLLPLAARGGQGDGAEERRLFYVGLTRAKDELILLAPGKPSPFLAELSPQIEASPLAGHYSYRQGRLFQ